MATTIRSMIESAKSFGCAATIYVDHKLYKVWAHGHVRVAGIHMSIDAAQQRMDAGRAKERARRVGLV